MEGNGVAGREVAQPPPPQMNPQQQPEVAGPPVAVAAAAAAAAVVNHRDRVVISDVDDSSSSTAAVSAAALVVVPQQLSTNDTTAGAHHDPEEISAAAAPGGRDGPDSRLEYPQADHPQGQPHPQLPQQPIQEDSVNAQGGPDIRFPLNVNAEAVNHTGAGFQSAAAEALLQAPSNFGVQPLTNVPPHQMTFQQPQQQQHQSPQHNSLVHGTHGLSSNQHFDATAEYPRAEECSPHPSFQSQMDASSTASPNAMILFYEAQMRDHAVAYASAAAGAAWAAAQVASQAMDFVAHRHGIPPQATMATTTPFLPPPPPPHQHQPFLPSPNYPSQQMGLPQLPPPPGSHLFGSPPHPQHGMGQPFPSHPHQQQHPSYNPAPGAYAPVSAPFSVEPPMQHQHPSHFPLYGQHREYQSDHPHSSTTSTERMGRLHPAGFRGGRGGGGGGGRGDDDGDLDANYPRKRQQRLPPLDSPKNLPLLDSVPRSQQQQRDKIRRRLRSDNDSSSSGSSWMRRTSGNSNHNSNAPQSGWTTGTGSNRGSNHHNKKKKARSDESLIGKTGVAALFEWCSKRPHQPVPTFTLTQANPPTGEFECIVLMERKSSALARGSGVGIQQEWGRGCGLQKGAAKQAAARRALQALLPGVMFDESGILIQVTADDRMTTAYHLEDLAPNLERQLALGQDDNTENPPNPRWRIEPVQPKRSLGIYPETSTTSEEELDPSTYYASRGASVCSVLLYAMIQIDSARIPEAPTYSYELESLGTTRSNVDDTLSPFQQSKRKLVAGTPNAPRISAARGSFTCTARLKVLSSIVARKPTEEDTNDADSGGSSEEQSVETLVASGVGGTKREARHVASAKLLALLFPECNGMAEVKAAAEAMRERYAANKAAQKQQNSALRTDNHRVQSGSSETDNATDRIANDGNAFQFALQRPDDPPLPPNVEDCLNVLSENTRSMDHSQDEDGEADLILSVNAVALCETSDLSAATVCRQISRQKQVDSLVELALQCLNEQDEEGRTTSGELTEDDVGRTILRRAEPDDLPWITKLFQNKVERRSRASSVGLLSELTQTMTPQANANDYPNLVSRLWSTSSSSSIVLLLCRAIAAHEDPPLGCAVLTLGFSMETGRALCLAEIANEPHLPQERFIECLQDFATCMKCTLSLPDTRGLCSSPAASAGTTNRKGIRLSADDCATIIKSHTLSDEKPSAVSSESRTTLQSIERANELLQDGGLSQLQSVQEESEVSDDSSSPEKRASTVKQRGADVKPSKRSRFE